MTPLSPASSGEQTTARAGRQIYATEGKRYGADSRYIYF